MENNCIQQETNSIDYDYENDSLFFFTRGTSYRESFDLDNIIIDFDENNHIKGVEIPDASERFGISKDAVKPENTEINLKISEKKIKLRISMTLQKKNKEIPRVISVTERNITNIPPETMVMSV